MSRSSDTWSPEDEGAGPPFDPGDGGLVDRGVIGEGGWGEVRRKHDPLLERDVAVKRLRPEHASRGPMVARFLAEARVTARLDHPAVVPVYQLGRDADGAFWFSMKEVRGITLTEAQRRRVAGDPAWPLSRVLDGFRRACEGVSYAHAQGIVHRDLKPDNIMLGAYGEAWVLDWGIARDRARDEAPGADASLPAAPRTLAGSAVGTPGYMSPEHAGGAGACTPRSDVWSLGAVLHELLSGDVPTEGRTVEELVSAARSGRVRPTAGPPELASIARRALSADPARRHADAAAFAADLSAWLAGAPVPSHRYSLGARAGRWLAAHGRLVVGLGLAAAVVAAGITLTTTLVAWQGWRAARASEAARVSLGRMLGAAAAEAAARGLEPDATLLAHAALEAADDPRARGVLAIRRAPVSLRAAGTLDEKCRDLAFVDGAFVCASEFAGLLTLTPDGAVSIDPRPEGLARVAFGDGGRLRLEASRTTPTLTVWEDGVVRVRDPGHGRWTRAAELAGADVLSAGQDETLRRWDARTGEERGRWALGAPVERLAWEGPGTEVVHWVDGAQALHRFDLRAGAPLPALPGDTSLARLLALSPDGAHLAVGGWIGGRPGLRVWSLAGEGAALPAPPLSVVVTAVSWAGPDELWVGDQTGRVHRCRLGARACEALRADDRVVFGVARAGDALATLGMFGRWRTWRVGEAPFARPAPGPVFALRADAGGWWVHEQRRSLRFPPGGGTPAAEEHCVGVAAVRGEDRWCAGDGRITLTRPGAPPRHAPLAGNVEQLLPTADGVVSVGAEVLAWSAALAATRLPVTDAPGHDVGAVDGRWLVVSTAGTATATLDLVDLAAGSLVDTLPLERGAVSGLAARDRGGDRPEVWATTWDGELVAWGPGGVARRVLGASLEAVAVDPTSGRLAVARDGAQVAVAPAPDAEPSWVVPLPDAAVHLAFGPDGSLLVATADGALVPLDLGAPPARVAAEAAWGARLAPNGAVTLAP